MAEFFWPPLASSTPATITLSGDVSGSGTTAITTTIGAGKVTNAMLAGSIAYSKLSLTGSILNADLAGSIAYSKLALTGSILNADLAGSIAYSKLSLTGAILNSDLAGSIAYSKLSLTGSLVTGDLASGFILPSAKGGTGVNNAGSLTYGSNNLTFTTSGVTSLTLPTTGTLATLSGSETLSSKTLVSPSVTGTLTVGVSGDTSTHQMYGNKLNLTEATASTAALIQAIHTDNTSSTSHAKVRAQTGGTSGGTPVFSWFNNNDEWVAGIDAVNPASWRLSHSAALQTNDCIIVDKTTNGVSIRGTNTNDSAATGFVGQVIDASVLTSTSCGASAAYFDLTSFPLTKGHWDVYVQVLWIRNSASFASTDFIVGLSTTTGNSGTGLNSVKFFAEDNTVVNTAFLYHTMNIRLNLQLAADTTYYVKGQIGSYTVATPQYQVYAVATRIR